MFIWVKDFSRSGDLGFVISKILSLDWALWFFWIMATSLGWLLGGFIFANLALVTSGLLIGGFQSLALQEQIARPWRWLIATAAGWIVEYMLIVIAFPVQAGILNGFMIGLTTGLAQWLTIRHEMHWSGWWIVFSVIGWVTGLNLLPGAILTGTMAGLLTGLPLVMLLRPSTRSPRHM